MSARHPFVKRPKVPDAFVALAREVQAVEHNRPVGWLLHDRRVLRIETIEKLLASEAVAFHATKALRLENGTELLRTAIEYASQLPEQLEAADTRSPADKIRYLEDVQAHMRELIRQLDKDRPWGSELGFPKKEAGGKWPTHPFYRDRLLEEISTAPFALARHLVAASKRQPIGKQKAKLPLSRLQRLLELADEALADACAKFKAQKIHPNKGNGPLREAVWLMDSALDGFSDLFANNTRRLSRHGLVAALVDAACPGIFVSGGSYALTSTSSDNDAACPQISESGDILDHKIVHGILKARRARVPS